MQEIVAVAFHAEGIRQGDGGQPVGGAGDVGGAAEGILRFRAVIEIAFHVGDARGHDGGLVDIGVVRFTQAPR
jgi:hypothetical protein